MLDDLILKLGTFSTSAPTRVVPIKWAIIITLLLIFTVSVVIVMIQNWENYLKIGMIIRASLATVVALVVSSCVLGGNIFSSKTFTEVTAEVDMNNPKVQKFFQNKDELLEAQKHIKYDSYGTRFSQLDNKVYFSIMIPTKYLKLVSGDKNLTERSINRVAEEFLEKVYNKSGKSSVDLVFDKK